MKKSHKFDEFSDTVCSAPGCEKKIKARLSESKTGVHLCYYHWCVKESGRAHYVNAAPRKKRIILNLPVKSFA